MPLALSEQMRLIVDVSILLKRKEGALNGYAIIDRNLVDLLIAIRDTGSVQSACDQLCCSTRNAQRLLKRFTENSGLEVLRHKGPHGTELTTEGQQCIDLYVAARTCVQQIVREGRLPRALPPLPHYPIPDDYDHRAMCQEG